MRTLLDDLDRKLDRVRPWLYVACFGSILLGIWLLAELV